MRILETIVHGLRQALAARKLVALLWLINLLAAVPASLLLSVSLAESFGTSLVAENMREGFDTGWYGEFDARAKGLETTFSPTVSGPGPVLDHLEAFWSGELFTNLPGVVALGLGFAIFWAFLLGGVLKRLAQQQVRPEERMKFSEFTAAGGEYFFRFFGLAALAAVFYFFIYRLGGWLYSQIRLQTGDVTEERTVLLLVMMALVLVVFLLNFTRMVFDYAKIIAVLENQHNPLKNAWAGLHMVLLNPVKTLGVYFGFGALTVLLFTTYALAAPGAGQSTAVGVFLAFLFGQVYLVARLVVRVGLLGGQMRFYRSRR